MKINIGPFPTDIIPVFWLATKYEIWRRPDTCFLPEKEYTKTDKLVFGLIHKLNDIVRPLNRWSYRRKRKVEVHVDNYDVWSVDHTLSLIIVPVLKKLKEVESGHPSVDNKDLPKELRSKKDEERWNYVLDEMIWAFEQHIHDDSTSQFHHNVDQLDMVFEPLSEDTGKGAVKIINQKDPTKPAYWVDREGIAKHEARMDNGRRLFAKYYRSLWD